MEENGAWKYPRPFFVGYDAPVLTSNVPIKLHKGAIVRSAPRSIGFGTPRQLQMLLGQLDLHGGKALAIDVAMRDDGAMEFDREMTRFRLRSGWLAFGNLRGRANTDALDAAFAMACTVRHYGQRIPGLARFSEPGQCFRVSIELKIQRGDQAVEPYDVLTHLDVVTEEQSTPVAEMLMSTRNPGLVIDQRYKYHGVEKAKYATLPKNIRQARPGEWVLGFAPTMLHSAPPEIDGTRYLVRVFVAPISREEFHYRAPLVTKHFETLKRGEPVQARKEVVWNRVNGLIVPTSSYSADNPQGLSLPGDPPPYIPDQKPMLRVRALE